MGMWNLKPVKGPVLRGSAGFTLLEVMVALAVVAIALVPLLRLHLLSLDATLRAQDLSTAVLLAQEKMSAMPPFPDAGEEQGTFEGPDFDRFRWQTAVTEEEVILAAQPIAIRHLVVTVLWTDGQREHQYTLESYKTQ
jgi:general secretion pathway protein I